MNSPQGLLVVAILGLFSIEVHGRPSCSGNFVAENINRAINTLIVPLDLNDNKLVGHPVFLEKIKTLDGKLEKHEQWLFWNATLGVYLNIFSKMLEEEKSEEVKDSLKKLSFKVEELKRQYYHDKIKMKLQELADIKTTNTAVQKKAVNEFKEVFQEASRFGQENTKTADC